MIQSQQQNLQIDQYISYCQLVGKNLERNGYLLEFAHDSASGIASAASGKFSLIILDHHLPDRDGLGTLAELNALPHPPPVIYLTGSEDSRVAVGALKAGAADYVVKDVHGDFLVLLDAAIHSALLADHLRRAKEAAEAEILAARDRYKALAEERALLLKEVNHRVGNSLQLIASLLQMQMRMAAKTEIKDALLEANRRVMAVAQVHRRLYTSDNLQRVSLREYLSGLIEDIRAAASDEHAGIVMTLNADDVFVDPDQAVAIGIVVTELVLNAMKHAYPNGRGPVRVVLRARGLGVAELSVDDDGIGLVSRKTPSTSGLGGTIINAMAQKLGSEVLYEAKEQGTRAKLDLHYRTIETPEDTAALAPIAVG